MFKQAMDLPRPPRELQPDLPEAIDAVMLKALAKEPGDRYQTPTEFVRALSAAVESHRALETIRPEAPEEPGPITPTAPPSASELTKWAAEEEATPAATPPTAQPAAVKKRRLGTWLVAGAGTLALFLCAWFAIASLRVLIPLVAEPARTRGFLPDKVEIVRYSPDGQLILTLHDDDILRV